MAKKGGYTDQDITKLEGPDQVRLRPAVIFGSNGIEGCEHSVFEILSNSIDERGIWQPDCCYEVS